MSRGAGASMAPSRAASLRAISILWDQRCAGRSDACRIEAWQLPLLLHLFHGVSVSKRSWCQAAQHREEPWCAACFHKGKSNMQWQLGQSLFVQTQPAAKSRASSELLGQMDPV